MKNAVVENITFEEISLTDVCILEETVTPGFAFGLGCGVSCFGLGCVS